MVIVLSFYKKCCSSHLIIKTGNKCNAKNNYRPITLVKVASKTFASKYKKIY